jgi:hypothetical protein
MGDQAKHTPGPWGWEFHPRMRTKAIALVSGKVDVLLATGDDENSWANLASEADAALIAAAPELLGACQSAIEVIADAIMHGMPITPRVAGARNSLVTAIARAEGRDPNSSPPGPA